MPPKNKPNNASKPPSSTRLTRSHTRADAEANTSTGLPEGSTTKAKSNGKNSDDKGKRKLDDTGFDELDAADGIKDGSGSNIEKRTKKAQPEPRTYMNPFIPKPSLTVAEHEAHSRAIAETPRLATLSDASTNGQSLFSKSLASVPNQDIVPAPLKSFVAVPKPRSQTPARPLLILAPLPLAKPKSITDKARNIPVPTPAHRPFLAPSSTRASSPSLTSTRFSTPFSSSSTHAPSELPARPQSPLLTKSAVSQKTSKVVADKISSLETRVARLEDEMKNIQGSLADVKKSQRKTTEENDELTKLRDEFGELKEESEAQRKLLHSIERILEGLKADGSNLDKAVTKIETSTRNNAFNVGDISYFSR
jgi:hypothetical protein